MDALEMHYNSDYQVEAHQADELMIANMLNALNNPHILKLLDDEELKTLLQVVKNHIVLKAGLSLEKQQKVINGTYGTSLNDIRGKSRL